MFLLYLATWAVVALTPGPAVICSMAQSARFGFRSSIAGIFGIQVGNFLFFVGIALGVGTMLATAGSAFVVLRTLGAIYLFYLGFRIIVSTFRKSSLPSSEPASSPPENHNLFLEGLLIQLTNPKALLFVSALLPQFIEVDRSIPVQLVILVFTTIAVDTIVLSSYAWLAQRGFSSFRNSPISTWIERSFGAGLVFFGFGLLISRK